MMSAFQKLSSTRCGSTCSGIYCHSPRPLGQPPCINGASLMDRPSFEKQVVALFHLVDYEVVKALARRPLPTTMVFESISELEKSSGTKVSLNSLYETFTSTWISRDPDQQYGSTVLITPDKKYEFSALLALKLHLSGFNDLAFHGFR